MKISTADYEVSYLDMGRGPVVVLLHAFPLSKEMWELQIVALAEDVRIIAPDAPGFGESSPFSGAPSIEQAAERVAGLLDGLGIEEPVVLGGLSMGGYTALAFARKFPERLRALILADTKADPDDEAARAKRGEMIAFAEENGGGAVVEKMLPNLLSPITREQRPEVVDVVRALGQEHSMETITNALAALRDRPDARPGLDSIQVPTLVIGGADDAVTGPEVMAGMAQQIAGARHIVVPDAGHLANLEQPQVFSAHMQTFLDTISES